MTEETLFERAVQLAGADRAAFLDRECAGLPELRARVESLLSADETSHSPLDHAVAIHGMSLTTDQRLKDQAGIVIAGKYTLGEVIGEGGMGSVWRAKQTEPVKRFVAVKLIKAGMDSRQVLARFEAERQALALMDHPNIAKVLDGGLHEQRPFFVMELVKGVPITEYCDHHRLTPKQRLELFVQACQAIQHAHQKGIIHRDIKPRNVLVALYDDRPVVKVIDFGVAKATGGTLTEATVDTGFGSVVGTPEYMSPEQATFNNLDIDTRSDVYALGVLLYELLAGSPPFSKRELGKLGLLEILRVVREEEPPRPSNKLSTADALPTLSANRGTEPKKLTGLLRNELDWIVMKALEKDRTRRYETANGFAADVSRYLSGEPVLAHPPSTAYRLQKFVRRNRPQVIAASLILLALLVGIVGTTWGLLEARRQAEIARNEASAKESARAEEAKQRLLAETNERKAKDAAEQERLAKVQITAQLKQIERINDTVFDIFAGFDIHVTRERGETTEVVLAKKLVEIGRTLDETAIADPVVLANLRGRLGLTLISLGYPREAIDLILAAHKTAAEKFGPNHPNTQELRSGLAEAYQETGRHDLALPLHEESLKLTKAQLGPDHHSTWVCMSNLARCYREAGKFDLALPLYEEELKLTKAKAGANHPDTLGSMHGLALGYRAAGKLDLAIPLYEETLELMKTNFGPDHPETLTCMNNLAVSYRLAGKLDLARQLYEAALPKMKTKFGPDHPTTLSCMHNLAKSYQVAGKLDLALPLYEESLKLRRIKLGPEHPETLTSLGTLAVAYREARKFDRAAPLLEELLVLQEKKLGRAHSDTQKTIIDLGLNYKATGRIAEAIPLLEEAYRSAKEQVGPALLDAYGKTGNLVEAARLINDNLADARKILPKDSPQLAGLLAESGLFLINLKGYAEAEPLLRESLAIREQKQPDAWTTFSAQALLGRALLGQKKFADAEPLLLKGYEGMKARENKIPVAGRVRLPESLDALIELYTSTEKPDDVQKWQAERAKYPATKQAEPASKEIK